MSEAPVEIQSPANPRIKEVVRLRERRERDASGLTIVDGGREIRRALEAGVEFVEVFVHEPFITTDDARAAHDMLLAGRGGPSRMTSVSAAVIDKIAFGDRGDGLVAVVRMPGATLGGLALPSSPFLAVVQGIEKPGNLGAILRSADGAGLDAIVVADPRTDVFNPNAIRASLGTIFARPVVTTTSAEALAWLRERGVRIVAARVDGAIDHTAADLTGPLAIILGSEADGLTDTWLAEDVLPVRLPMLGIADSLNVAAAAAVLFYEAVRQRQAPSDVSSSGSR